MKRLLTIAAVVVVLGVGAVLVGGAVTSAQEGDGPIGTFLERLAGKLGIGQDELKTAIQETQTEMIDEQVADGTLTAEQGERLKERIGEKGFLGPLDRFGIRVHVRGEMGGLTVEAAATVLGMEPDELLAELRDGTTMAEVAEGQGMAVDKFTSALLDQVRQDLDAQVADGTLTEDQANNAFQRIEENIDSIVNAEAGPCGPGGRWGGPGGFGGGWFGPPSDEAPSDSSSEETPQSTATSGVTA